MARAILKVGYRCNNRCRFCHSARLQGIPDLLEEALASRIREVRDAGFHGVVLSGGEPGTRKDLLKAATLARALGLAFGIISNGRMFSYGKLVDGLAARGMDYAYLSLHAADPATHDALVGIEGAQVQSLAGLRNAARHPGIRLTANTVVVNRNLGGLRPVVELLAAIPRVRIKLSYVEPRGAVLERTDEIPSPAVAADAMCDALGHGLRLGLPRSRLAWDGLPFCMMDGWIDRFADLFTDDLVCIREADEDHFPMVDYRNMARRAECRGCLIGDDCRGTWSRTWDFFPEAEVSPITGGRSNSFNLAPTGETLLVTAPDACPVRAGVEAGGPAPGWRTVHRVRGDGVEPTVTDTRDFDRGALLGITHGLGQVYVDRAGAVLVDDFAAQLQGTEPQVWCRGCPLAGNCGGAFRPVEGDRFAAAEREVRGILEGISGVILDVGCGVGRYPGLFEALLSDGTITRYLALDPAPGHGVRALAARFGQVEILEQGAETLDLPPHSVDHALVLRSHNHLDDPWEAYSRILSAIRPGGRLLVVDNTAFALVREEAEVRDEVAALDGLEPEHLRNHTGPEAEAFLRRFPVKLLLASDVGPGTANQWLRLYEVHHWRR
ncbi:MAG: radical SAM protein [Pseudomonadota bacterium]